MVSSYIRLCGGEGVSTQVADIPMGAIPPKSINPWLMVRIRFDRDQDPQHALRPGMSVEPSVRVR